MCVITTAFLAIAKAQQKAMGYLELPFVAIQHPVAVSEEAEIREKVKAVYSDFVESFLK